MKLLTLDRRLVGTVLTIPPQSGRTKPGYVFNPNVPGHRSSRKIHPTPEAALPRWAVRTFGDTHWQCDGERIVPGFPTPVKFVPTTADLERKYNRQLDRPGTSGRTLQRSREAIIKSRFDRGE